VKAALSKEWSKLTSSAVSSTAVDAHGLFAGRFSKRRASDTTAGLMSSALTTLRDVTDSAHFQCARIFTRPKRATRRTNIQGMKQ